MDVNDFINDKISLLEDTGGIQPIQEGSAAWWEMQDRIAALPGRMQTASVERNISRLLAREARLQADREVEM